MLQDTCTGLVDVQVVLCFHLHLNEARALQNAFHNNLCMGFTGAGGRYELTSYRFSHRRSSL